MRHRLRQPALTAIAVGSLMTVGLGACGSSSSSTTATQANAAATSPASGTTGGGATAGSGATGRDGATGQAFRTAPTRASAVRECLQRNGVKLPAGRGAGELFLGGGPPKGVTTSQLRAAMRKCLGRVGPLPRAGNGRFSRVANPRFRQALAGFAACMRKNGVNVPTPNTSGNGPVFSTKGLNTASPQFRAAAAKCRLVLTSAFRRPSAGRPTG